MAITLEIHRSDLRLKAPFRIAGHIFETSPIVTVTLRENGRTGRGEASGVFFLDDTVDTIIATLEENRRELEAVTSREELRTILPPGGARNAVDCALWELEAARARTPVWALAGLAAPRALRTTFTIGADTPEAMAAMSVAYVQAKSIKVKLTGDVDLDLARVIAIRAARPDAWLGVDGNQGFTRASLDALLPGLVDNGVSLVEQPLARGHDAELEWFNSPIPLAGDESICSLADVAGAVGRFNVVNIKLDKCGGLTEGLLMAAEARRLGLAVMVGTMVGTSLATAPGFVLGQVTDLVDLDGPTFLAEDVSPSVVYANGEIWSGPEVWGTPLGA
ncbi:dipeptide epimerase [Glacieibacterium megasporae]|uniref:dipeptide epimerase n=1 Tax=Glacieibacterium megasporae TaxID=2835787 RepID=UPI002102391C|nr:dipeptide epimerase [Polymorphobacter megasporae]